MTSAAIYVLLLGVFVEVTRSSPSCNITTEKSGYVYMWCQSPSGSSVVLKFNRARNELTLKCEKGTYSCPMMSKARPVYESVRVAATATPVDFLKVEGCALGEPLVCALRAINANDTTRLVLRGTSGNLLPMHVEALGSVQQLEIWYGDASYSSMPYEALSQLPDLREFKVRKGDFHVKEKPEQQLLQLTKLELATSELKVLPARGFSSTPNVKTLLLWENNIDDIDKDAFKDLSKLEKLDLNRNKISHLPSTVFQPCRSLKRLDMGQNRIERLHSDLFANLTELGEVEISKNSVEMVIENDTFADLTSLKILTMEGSQINFLPENLFRGSPLEILKLSRNNISELATGIFSGVKLKILDLSRNRIRNATTGVFSGLADLTNLNLNNNKLEQLKSGIFVGLRSLTTLDLSYNLLTTLGPSIFIGLRSLTTLHLSYNLLTNLSLTTFDGLGSLTTLDLSHNKLSTLYSFTFDVLPSLLVLSVSHNQLQIGDITSPFRTLLQLNTLELQHNLLTHVCADWHDLLYLKTLDLSHNAITQLTMDDMKWIISVTINESIDLSHNNITNITPYVYSQTARLPYFVLNDNTFSCDCTLYPFIKARIDNKPIGILREDDLICSSPPVLAGRSFSNIKELRCSTCPSNCSCGIRISPTTTVYELNCSSVPLPFPSNFDLPIQLTLNSIPNKISNLPPSVKHLIMSNLSMTGLPRIDYCSEVDLRHNLLKEAPLKLLEANCSVKLAHNPFKCDCDNQQTFTLIKKYENQIIDFSEVTCDGGLTIQNHLVEELCVTKNAILLGVGVSAGLLSLGACVILIYTKRTLIRLYLIRYGLYHPGQVGRRDTKYDAFVSYEVEDERYVFHQLIPKLESGRCPLRLCIPCRDWEVGGLISEQISQSVQGSRVTIVVLSTRYGKSTWRNIEFRTAQALQRIIVLLMDDVAHRCSELGLNTYTSMNKCIKASDTMAMYKIKQAVGEG